VGNGSEGRVVDGERDGSKVLDSSLELGKDILIGDLGPVGLVDGASLVDGSEDESIREGHDSELSEEVRLRSSDLGSGLDELNVVGDFDLSSGNLTLDVKGL